MKPVLLLSLFIFFSMGLFSQSNFNAAIGSGPPQIDVITEYFSNMDTAFSRKNKISEIVCTETCMSYGVLLYAKPVLIYRFDGTGKRTHVETNNWSENGGGVSRYTDYYRDSTISVTHEEYKHPGQASSDYLTIYKTYLINDTLSRTVEFGYRDDSLYKMKDNGIYDSKAEAREYRKRNKSKNASVKLMDSETLSEKDEMPRNTDIDDYPRLPLPTEEKDALGRVTRITTNRLVKKNEEYVSKPSRLTIIGYYKNTRVLSSVDAYYLEGQKVYDTIPPDHKINEPGVDPRTLSYTMKATDFQFQIPGKVVIRRGKNGGDVKTYLATIRTR